MERALRLCPTAVAAGVEHPESELPGDVSLLGGRMEPVLGSERVALEPQPGRVLVAEARLRERLAAARGAVIPVSGLLQILRRADTGQVHLAQPRLCRHRILLPRAAIPVLGLAKILRHLLTTLVQACQAQLRLPVTLLGQFAQHGERFGAPAAGIRPIDTRERGLASDEACEE